MYGIGAIGSAQFVEAARRALANLDASRQVGDFGVSGVVSGPDTFLELSLDTARAHRERHGWISWIRPLLNPPRALINYQLVPCSFRPIN